MLTKLNVLTRSVCTTAELPQMYNSDWLALKDKSQLQGSTSYIILEVKSNKFIGDTIMIAIFRVHVSFFQAGELLEVRLSKQVIAPPS